MPLKDCEDNEILCIRVAKTGVNIFTTVRIFWEDIVFRNLGQSFMRQIKNFILKLKKLALKPLVDKMSPKNQIQC